MPKQVNLNLMSKEGFDDEMENRYNEALNEKGITTHEYFKQLKKKVKADVK